MSNKPYLLIANWPAPKQVNTLITTRLGGYSKNSFTQFNLALHVEDDQETVINNRNLLNEYLPNPPHWLNQTHSNNVLELDYTLVKIAINDTYDASITRQKQQVCVVMTADCLPILLTDMNSSFVAAIHAGWRGLKQQIIAATVAKIAQLPQTMLAFIGPAICRNHFIVNENVRQEFIQLKPDNEIFFTPNSENKDKYNCDLLAIAKLQLRNLGIKNIYSNDDCTYCQSELFYSYRRENLTGRFASLIWLE